MCNFYMILIFIIEIPLCLMVTTYDKNNLNTILKYL